MMIICLEKDENSTSMVGIAKHLAMHTKTLPKYVALNLKGPNLVWVPSKHGWMCVGTKGIGGLIQMKFVFLIFWLNQEIEAFCIYTTQCHDKLMKSKVLSTYKCTYLVVRNLWYIWWLANNWDKFCYWMIISYISRYDNVLIISAECIWVD